MSRPWIRRARAGITLLEVMIAVLLVGVTIIPLMTSGQAISRQGHLTEHHALADSQARTLLDLSCSLDYALLEAVARKAPAAGTPAPLLLDTLLTPEGLDLLFSPALGTPPELVQIHALYKSKLDNFRHWVTVKLVEDDLIDVQVLIKWQDAADKKASKEHELKQGRLVRRGQHSMTEGVP